MDSTSRKELNQDSPPSQKTFPFLSKFQSQIASTAAFLEKSLLADEKQPHNFFRPSKGYSFKTTKNSNFRLLKAIQVPPEITECVQNNKYISLCGVSLALDAAWFVSDHKLILWDFATQRHQLLKPSGRIIRAVQIIETPPSVSDQLENSHVIVFVATASEILILAGDRGEAHPFSLKKKLAVPTGGETVVEMAASKKGEIFALSDGGDLLELEYQGWRSRVGNLLFGSGRKLRRVSRTSAVESVVLPLKRLFGSGERRLGCLCVEDSRGLLFAASEEDVFCWSTSEEGAALRCGLKRVLRRVVEAGLSRRQSLGGERIVAVKPVSRFECDGVCVVLVTDRSTMIFVGLENDNKLSIVSLIEPPTPPAISSSDTENAPSACSANTVLYEDNLLLFAARHPAPGRKWPLRAISSQRAPPPRNNSATPQTAYCLDELSSADEVSALCELPPYRRRDDLAYYCYAQGREFPLFGLSDAALALFSSCRLFYALTARKLSLVSLNDPLRTLIELLRGDFQTEKLSEFASAQGSDEACAMCLAAVCCELPSHSQNALKPSQTQPENESTANKAKSAYFALFSGSPQPFAAESSSEHKKAESSPSPSAENKENQKNFVYRRLLAWGRSAERPAEKAEEKTDFREIVETAFSRRVSFRPSARLAGLSLFLARLLRPLWRFPLVGYVQTKEFRAKVPFVVYAKEILSKLAAPLRKLEAFLSKYKSLFYSNHSTNAAASSDAVGTAEKTLILKCRRVEVERVEGLHKIVSRAVEVLAFALRAAGSAASFNIAFGKLAKEEKRALLEKPFASLVCFADGEAAVKALMGRMVDVAPSELQFFKEHCPSLFRVDDVLICGGNRFLEDAIAALPNRAMFFENSRKAEKEFFAAAELMGPKFPLEEVGKAFRRSGSFSGLVKVALKVAGELPLFEASAERGELPVFAQKCHETALGAVLELLARNKDYSDNAIDAAFAKEETERMRTVVIGSKDDEFKRMFLAHLLEKDQSRLFLDFYADIPLAQSLLREKCTELLAAADIAFVVFLRSKKYFEGAKLARYWAVIRENVALEKRSELAEKSRRFFRSIEAPSAEEKTFDLMSQQYQTRIALQTRVARFLEQNKADIPRAEFDRGREALASKVLSVAVLYRSAKLLRCYTVCLELHHHGLVEDASGQTLADFWRFVVSSEMKASFALDKENWRPPFVSVLAPLIRKWRGTPVLRIDVLGVALESAGAEHLPALSSWVVDFLASCGVSAADALDGYIQIVDSVKNDKTTLCFLSDFKRNCLLSLSITRVLEKALASSQAAGTSESEKLLVCHKGVALASEWRSLRKKAADDRQRKARRVVDQRFFEVGMKLKSALDMSW